MTMMEMLCLVGERAPLRLTAIAFRHNLPVTKHSRRTSEYIHPMPHYYSLTQ